MKKAIKSKVKANKKTTTKAQRLKGAQRKTNQRLTNIIEHIEQTVYLK